jgi:hypothetical protein
MLQSTMIVLVSVVLTERGFEMAKQLLLWASDVLESQKLVVDTESKMLKAKSVFLERKHAHENAKKELSAAIKTEFERVDGIDQ